jgi:hypothetical protein
MKEEIKENITNDIQSIEINDSCAYVTGSKVIARIVINAKNGMKNYKIVRTSKGKYMMQ